MKLHEVSTVTWSSDDGDSGHVIGLRDDKEQPTDDLDLAHWGIAKSLKDGRVFWFPLKSDRVNVEYRYDEVRGITDERH